jgi:glucokinase
MGLSRNIVPGLPLLVGDIGGTSTRLALVTDGEPVEDVRIFPTPDGDLVYLLRAFLDSRQTRVPASCALAGAGLVQGEGEKAHIRLTNRDTIIDAGQIARALGCPVVLCNDLAALAASLPELRAGADVQLLDGARGAARGTRLVVAVGTGFGAAIVGAHGEVIATEAGHTLLPGGEARQIEDVLSGIGLAAQHPEFLDATDLARAVQSRDPAARALVREFAALLGRVLGNLVLATGAWGGVYLSGGVIGALLPVLPRRPLRAALRSHPQFSAQLARVPLLHIRAGDASLRGLARLARESAAAAGAAQPR